MGKLTKELQEINKNIKSLLATSLAKHLSQYTEGRAASSTPVSDVDNSVLIESPSPHRDQPSVAVEEVVATKPYEKELLSLAEITPIYTKSRNRHNFAALLVKRLFDEPTRMRCNVAGRGKEKLDPDIMMYIQAKVFEYYECNPSEIKKEWTKCVTAIDEKSRALKRLKSKKSEN